LVDAKNQNDKDFVYLKRNVGELMMSTQETDTCVVYEIRYKEERNVASDKN
jgi:hypothetical protein